MKHKVLRTALYIVLALVGVITVFPFVWMVLSSFKTNGEIQSIVQTLLPQEATVDNYLNLQETFDFLRYFMNSIFIAVAVTVLVIYTSCLCGYVLGKYQFKGKNIIFGFVMMTMMVPWSVTIIPRYTMFMEAGLQDTYLSLILPVMVSGFGIFMMKQNMESIPDELIEAARVDGANEFVIFFRLVMMPMKSTFAAAAIYAFMKQWNNYLWPLIVIQTNDKKTFTLLLSSLASAYYVDYGQLMLAIVLATLPIIVVFLTMQKQFVEGITGSSK